MSKLVSIISVATILATPASADWRDSRIDGTSARTFEQSVALLLNELPRGRREDFEIALALIWLSNTTDASGDVDHDGDADYRDVRLLKDVADDLLSAIKRGDVVAAIEELEGNGNDYTSARYFMQLDGLRFDDVVSLAGQPINGPALAALRQEAWCRRSTSQSQIRALVCERAGAATAVRHLRRRGDRQGLQYGGRSD